MTQFVAIVNGAAGGGRCKTESLKVLPRLREAGYELDVQETTRAGEATEIARAKYASGARAFLSVGGDGTSYEVINGIFPRKDASSKVTLGILPLGTGNSFLRDFGITSSELAIESLLTKKTRSVDVVRAAHADGEIHYINLLSIGFSAAVGSLTNKRFKPFGPAGYAMAVVTSITQLPHPSFPLRLDEDQKIDSRPCTLLSFSNSRFTAGTMMMAPPADATDGKVDVIRVGALSRVQLLSAFPRIYKGTHLSHPLIEHTRARDVTFTSHESTEVMVDGEVLTLALKSLHVLPSALEVLA